MDTCFSQSTLKLCSGQPLVPPLGVTPPPTVVPVVQMGVCFFQSFGSLDTFLYFMTGINRNNLVCLHFLEKLIKGVSHQTILLACFGMRTGFSTIDIFGTGSKCYVLSTRNIMRRAVEMAQQLRALYAFAEDPSSI